MILQLYMVSGIILSEVGLWRQNVITENFLFFIFPFGFVSILILCVLVGRFLSPTDNILVRQECLDDTQD